MDLLFTASCRRVSLLALAGGLLLVVGGACSDSASGPSSEAAAAADTTATAGGGTTPVATPSDSTAPTDSAATPPTDTIATPDSTGTPATDSSGNGSAVGALLDTRSAAPGIALGTYGLESPLLGSVHTGTLRGGGLSATNLLPLLASIRAKGGRVILKFCNGRDSYVQNADGSFSLTKWKALVDRFKNLNLDSYIADGTIVGHFLIDEPHRAAKWKYPISQATVEGMAEYSKKLWPGMTTFVRVVPSWLASAPIKYTHLDAGWTQYTRDKGDAAKWVATEAEVAKSRGLGLVVGLNVLDGGDGSSRIGGWTRGKYAMSASEVRSYGAAVLNNSYACAFYMWMYDGPYYGRADIKGAMAELSVKSKAHVKTSCKQ